MVSHGLMRLSETVTGMVKEEWNKVSNNDIQGLFMDNKDADKILKEYYGIMGVVFSYQPYDAGPFSEGIIHIILPYTQIESSLKINR